MSENKSTATLNDNQLDCLKYFYKNLAMSKMLGEDFHMPYDKRTANSLVSRGLLRKISNGSNKHYIGYVITNRGVEIAKDIFGIIMNNSWDSLQSSKYNDIAFCTSRMRGNHVDNYSNEVPIKLINKANMNLFGYRDLIKKSFWTRRN